MRISIIRLLVNLIMMLLTRSAADNIVKADEIRTLVKDIWDIRLAKLRSSIDVFLKSEATHAKVDNP